MMAAFVLAFWRGRRSAGAYPIFTAWAAYQITLLVNFSALAAAFPFWVFAAAALGTWGAVTPARALPLGHPRLVAAAAVVIAGAAGLAVVSTVLPYRADVHLLNPVNADYRRQLETARVEANQARQLWPPESVYAVEVGNLAFERQDWAAARIAYEDAARLGTYNPLVYRNLALADRDLGLRSEGEAAARKAVELDRFDPANQALLAQFEVGAP
jgi:tetratricopeptide (TPR) repeat protein